MSLAGFAEISRSDASTAPSAATPGYPGTLSPGSPESGITVRAGGRISITDYARIISETKGSTPGGDIEVSANSLMIRGPDRADTTDERGRTTGLETVTQSAASGGDIRVKVEESIGIYQAGGIYASTNARGTSGDILVEGRDLEIVGARNYDRARWGVTTPKNFFITGISNKGARKEEVGNLGSITVKGFESIELRNGGLIDATNFSTGTTSTSGNVTVEAGSIRADRGDSDYFTGIGAGTEASGTSDETAGADGGDVTVRASDITLLNGAQIAASSRSGGDAGTVRVFTNHLFASGKNTETPFLFTGESGVLAATRSDSTGGAGNVIVSTLGGRPRGIPLIQLGDGAEIGARAEGKGAGGSVQVLFTGGRVELSSGASISARSGELGGTAGSVLVAGKIFLRSGSSISSTNQALNGDAGSVVLYPASLVVDGSRIAVSAPQGDAGEIRIEGGSLLDVRNQSEILAEAAGTGGNIFINGARHMALDHSLVSANASVGQGGNIQISPDVYLANLSVLTATGGTDADDGTVSIDSQAFLTGAEGQLETTPLDPTDSLQPECTDWSDTKAGSFIRAGRGGSARLPGGYLPSLRLYNTGSD